MRIVNQVWSQTTLAERQAFHRVTCNNSRLPDDLRLTQGIVKRIQAAIAARN